MPVTIDGDDLQDATIDGDPIQEITVDGDIVWVAREYVDDFLHNDVSQYYSTVSTSDPSTFATTSAWGDVSSISLIPAHLDGTVCSMYSFPPSSPWNDSEQPNDLPYYPQLGDEIHVRFRAQMDNDGSYAGGGVSHRFRWACDGVSTYTSIQLSPGLGGAPMYLQDYDSGGTTIDQADTAPWTAGDVYEWVINWGSTTTVDLLDITNGGTKATVSGSVQSTGDEGIGWRVEEENDPPIRIDAVWVE